MELQYGCLVVNAPTANTVAAAEHGIALICALSRNVAQADASVKRGEWKRSEYTGVSLVGKTLAIMGFGKVLILLSYHLCGMVAWFAELVVLCCFAELFESSQARSSLLNLCILVSPVCKILAAMGFE